MKNCSKSRFFAANSVGALILVGGLLAWPVEKAAPAQAQGFDWLTPKLESQRYGNQLRRNQKRREGRRTKRAVKPRVVKRYPTVQVNGQRLRSPVAPVEINGTTFVPFRPIFESLGARVSYENSKKLITATRGTRTMQIAMPGAKTDLGGTDGKFRVREMPFMQNGTLMVPLRLVSQTMGAKISYAGTPKARTISVMDG